MKEVGVGECGTIESGSVCKKCGWECVKAVRVGVCEGSWGGSV